jgi:predicted ATPase/DNA-binding CsgD family transcriptional regulator
VDQETPARLIAVPATQDRSFALAAGRQPAPHTSLVGREQELADVCALLGRVDVRLLTVTGPGGVGKTRLAIHAAEELATSFADGVAYIELAGVREPELALPAIYQALGGREAGSDVGIERFQALLGGRELLLVLDNFEHLMAAATNVTDLLAAFPRLKILVTSRAALQLSAEHEYLTPPLTLPAKGPHASSEEDSWSDALQLFVQRARASRRDLELTREALAAAGEICRRLDGLPLAIELAAARIDRLSPQAILGRLDSPGTGRLPLLTGGPRDQPARQQTMRDAIAWSYDLLDQSEQRMFQRLGVFIGGFSIPAASAVCELDELSMLDGARSLVAKSLVRYDGDRRDGPRYGMFETIREFALEELVASGQAWTARQRHAMWAVALAEQAGPQVKGPEAALWLDALERDHANLRAALGWFVEQRDGEGIARLAGALLPFWDERARYAEGRRWLETALELSSDVAARDRMSLLSGAGTMAWRQTDFAQAIRRHGQALRLARELGDREAEAFALNNLGVQEKESGNVDKARGVYEASIAIAREIGETHLVIQALHNLAQIQRVQGESTAALQSMEEVLALAKDHAVSWPLPIMLAALGLIATDLGDYDRALTLFHKSLALALAKGDRGCVVDGIESLARLAAMTGQPRPSIRLFAAAEALREELINPLPPIEAVYREPIMQKLRETEGEAGFAAAWAAGRRLSQEEALAEALALRGETAEGTAPGVERRASAHGLTERELEVLRLLVAGHSNREVGALLNISKATAARHVANIYNKLGVDSRSRLTVFALQHGLI